MPSSTRRIKWKQGTGIGKDLDSGTWVATWYEDRKKKMKRGLPTYQAAKDYKRERERAKKGRGRARETCDSLAERYVDDFHGRGGRERAETSKRWYRERLSKFASDFKGRPLSSVTREEAQRWAFENKDRVRAVAAMFSDAVRFEIDGLVENPFSGLRPVQSRGRSSIKVLTHDELGDLIKIARSRYRAWGDHFAGMIQTAAWTGLRPGELFALEWDDLDWEQGVIHVQRNYRSKTNELVEYTKNGLDRWVGLLPMAQESLRSIERFDSLPYVFHSAQLGRFQQHTLQHHWPPVRDVFTDRLPADHWLKRRLKANPKDRLDFYELRHLFGTTLANAGASPYVIASQMGHQDGGKLAMQTYIHTDALSAAEQARSLFAASPVPVSVAPGGSTRS